jgi:hypothetical protein
MNTANHEDANLLLRLYEMRREPRLRQARTWFMQNFRATTLEEVQALCPPGSDANASYRMVVSYWEMAASFVSRGLIDRELFYENSQELLIVWIRFRDVLPHSRVANKNPLSFKNLEEVALGFIDWWNTRAPGYLENFIANVRMMPAPAPAREEAKP